MYREEKSVEAIVEHLRTNHSNENPPRFMNGQFSKKKQKHGEGVIRPKETIVLPQFVEPLPSIYSQSPSFSILDCSLPNQSITVNHHQESSSIPVFQSISLDKHSYAINAGGCVTSSCFFTHGETMLLAISCMNKPQFSRFHRSTQSYHVDDTGSEDGYISIYQLNKTKPVLLYHIQHHHTYAVDLQIIPSTNQQLPESFGILSCLYIDGVIELLLVSLSLSLSHHSFLFNHSLNLLFFTFNLLSPTLLT